MITPTARNGAPAGSEDAETHHAGVSTIWLGSIPILREDNPGVGQESSFFSSPSTNLTRGLAARRLLPECREGTIHLQTSMPSPRFLRHRSPRH
ncbi:hypothetical protein TNCV_4557981 [Trichonephila clavipes]|nr:hypothetical protein TNCV_4557981 [Trichonephila clavipes]